MNNAQRGKLFGEWKDYLAVVKRDGGQVADERAARMAITRKALGVEKSWSENFSQKEIDILLAVIWALAQPGNLTLQLRQIDQPMVRAEGSLFAQAILAGIRDAARAKNDPELAARLDTVAGRESYLNAIARRIHKAPLCDLHDAQWRDILAALNHTRMHKLGVWHSHPSRGAQVHPARRKAAPRPVHAAEAAQTRGDPF